MEAKTNKGSGSAILLNAVKIKGADIDYASDEKKVAIKKTYACHFGKPNENNEVVNQDSFDEMFKKYKESDGIRPSINWQHDPRLIIGEWTDLVPNTIGLQVEGWLAKQNWFVREWLLPLIDAGKNLYLSTEGYCPWDAMEWNDEKGFYTAKQFDLIRISLVDVPADFEQKVVKTNAVELHPDNEEPKHEEKPNEGKKPSIFFNIY